MFDTSAQRFYAKLLPASFDIEATNAVSHDSRSWQTPKSQSHQVLHRDIEVFGVAASLWTPSKR